MNVWKAGDSSSYNVTQFTSFSADGTLNDSNVDSFVNDVGGVRSKGPTPSKQLITSKCFKVSMVSMNAVLLVFVAFLGYAVFKYTRACNA